MSTVFIGGSRRIAKLNDAIRARAKNIVNEGLSVVIGDANGADKAIQKFLAEEGYRNVVVYFSGGVCRNNIGEWETHQVSPANGERGFWFYAAKDIAMSGVADYGLMIWDGESVGTVHNILNLLGRGKLVVVYFAPEKGFANLRTSDDLEALLNRCPADAIRNFERQLDLTAKMRARPVNLSLAQ